MAQNKSLVNARDKDGILLGKKGGIMKRINLFLLIVLCASSSWACTSFIISGKATPTGRPMMFKHRDTGELNNRIAYFEGVKYDFMGLVNSPVLDGEVWAGMNEAGLCIMNTASYNLREDTLDCKMDREGEMMYHVLSHCATLADFEQWLNTYPQPWGVEANFGLIDAEGGAAYYEMNNFEWKKYDVNTMPAGYRVVTNFSEAGRYEDYEGWERYLTATAIMKEAFSTTHQMTPNEALDLFSRQYRHELLDIDFDSTNVPEYTVDQDFIPRRITSAVAIFEGVNSPADARKTVMWTALGYPACAVAIPLVMAEKEHIPAYMQAYDSQAKSGKALHCEMCDVSLQIKNQWAFPLRISNGKRYVNMQHILQGTATAPSLLTCTQEVEKQINEDFDLLYQQWLKGQMSDKVFLKAYDEVSKKWMQNYRDSFAPYLKNNE